MTKPVGALVAVLLLAAFPGSALAQKNGVVKVTPEYLSSLIESQGERVEELSSNEDGAVLNATTGDLQYQISFSACDDDGENCELMTFGCGLELPEDETPDLVVLNEWNNSRFGKALLDEDGVAWLLFEINVTAGLSGNNVQDSLAFWLTLVDEFVGFVGFE
jgi:hypothetical protein